MNIDAKKLEKGCYAVYTAFEKLQLSGHEAACVCAMVTQTITLENTKTELLKEKEQS